jgi:hypothetical protein
MRKPSKGSEVGMVLLFSSFSGFKTLFSFPSLFREGAGASKALKEVSELQAASMEKMHREVCLFQ